MLGNHNILSLSTGYLWLYLKRHLDIYQKAWPEVLGLNKKKMGPNLFHPILKLKKKKKRQLFTFLEIWKKYFRSEGFFRSECFLSLISLPHCIKIKCIEIWLLFIFFSLEAVKHIQMKRLFTEDVPMDLSISLILFSSSRYCVVL